MVRILRDRHTKRLKAGTCSIPSGLVFMEALTNLERAADQFENGETNTLEAALSCGFSNLSYFHREFKKKYGMTPKRFISLSARAADFHEGSE